MWDWAYVAFPAILVLGVGWSAAWFAAPMVLVLPALHRGRYGTAIRRIRWLRGSMGAELVEGAALLHADRLDEAEQVLRAAMTAGRGGEATLVYVAIAQERYEEALRHAWSATEGRAELGVVRALAELHAGLATEDTLRRLDQLWRKGHGEDAITAWLAPGGAAELHALRAWAAAELGLEAESKEAAARARAALPTWAVGTAGHVWCLLARAARAAGDSEAERAALASAAAIDASGVYGRIARDALATA